MDFERKVERFLENRRYLMERALRAFQQGKISRQKFHGLLRKYTRLPRNIDEADEDHSILNSIHHIMEHIKAAARGEEAVTAYDLAAKEIGLPPDSRTVRQYVAGEIDLDEARRRAEIIRYRHRKTDYDALLRAGYTKEEARQMMMER